MTETEPSQLAPRAVHFSTSDLERKTGRKMGDHKYLEIEKPLFRNNNVNILCKRLQKFAFEIYLLSQTETLMPNLVVSPLAIASVLSLMFAGAKEATAEQIKKLLRFESLAEDPQDVHMAFEELLKSFRPHNGKKAILHFANRIYVHKEFKVHCDFLALAQNHYAVTVPSVDFMADVDHLRSSINHWVEESTQKQIKEVVTQGGLDHLARAVLINCVYFNSPWQRKFYHDYANPGRFYTEKEKFTAMDVIQQQGRYPYVVSKDLKCSAIELAYAGDRVSCIILLPQDITGLTALEAKMNEDELELLLLDMKSTVVNVMLPRFHVETSLEYTDALARMGVEDMFSRHSADLSGMVENIENKDDRIFLSALYHGVKVEVCEVGGGKNMAVPTASNGCFCCTNSGVKFIADRPFMFVIRDTKSEMIMFIGRIREPTPPKKV